MLIAMIRQIRSVCLTKQKDIWLFILVLCANVCSAQYEYVFPRTEISSISGYLQPTNHPTIAIYSASAGTARLSNLCGYDTTISFPANSMVTLNIPSKYGRLYNTEKENVNGCNFILHSNTYLQVTCYNITPRSNGAYRVLEKSETSYSYNVAYFPFTINNGHKKCLDNSVRKDSLYDGINTTIVAFENNTKITIINPYNTGFKTFSSGSRTILLQRGESFTFQPCAAEQKFPGLFGQFNLTFPGGISVFSVDSCKPVGVFNFQLLGYPLETYIPDQPPNCDPYLDCVRPGFDGSNGCMAIQQLPDERLLNEYILVPNRMNRIQNPDINWRWYYRTSHYYIQTSVDNEIWLNNKRFVVPADSFLCDTFVLPVHVRSAKPVHAFTVNMVPRDFTLKNTSLNYLSLGSWVQDITYATTKYNKPDLKLPTPPNLITKGVANCLLVYAFNSDTVNLNGKRFNLRFKDGRNFYDTIGARESSKLYSLYNASGLSAVYMSLVQTDKFYPAGGVHSLDPVPPVW